MEEQQMQSPIYHDSDYLQFDLTQNYEDDSKVQHGQISSCMGNRQDRQPRVNREKNCSRKSNCGLKVRNKKIAKSFTMQEDQKILNLVLKFGPKFKKVTKAFNGKSLNVIKNHYYRNLRFRWHEVLGMEFIHLNEKKEEVTFNTLLTDVPIHSDLKQILNSCFNGIQELFQNYMTVGDL